MNHSEVIGSKRSQNLSLGQNLLLGQNFLAEFFSCYRYFIKVTDFLAAEFFSCYRYFIKVTTYFDMFLQV